MAEATTTRRRVGALLRISDARDDDTAGVDRQEADCRERAARLNCDVVEVYVENDTSAFKRKRIVLPDGSIGLRVVRPEFRRALDDLISGAIDGIIGWDLDRVARDPRDLEDLIDAVEQTGALATSVTGSLDLSTDAGVTMSRIMVAIGNKSSRDSSRRIKRKHEELAEQGKIGGGGKRRYGFENDRRTVILEEAEIVHEMARRVLGDDDTEPESLRAIALDLTARGVPTALRTKREDGRVVGWHARSVHSILTGGHVAGLRKFRGEIVGEGDWPKILDRDTWDRIQIALAERNHGAGNRLKKWLTGVLVCGQCGRRMIGWSNPRRPEGNYWCASIPPHGGCGKTVIDVRDCQATAEKLIFAYLRRPDVIDALTKATSSSAVGDARKAMKQDEAQLKELATMWGARAITMPEYLAARGEIETRLGRWKGVVRQGVPGTVRKLLSAETLEEGWETMTPVARREVARVLYPHGIEIIPPTVKFVFDPERLNPLKAPRKVKEL